MKINANIYSSTYEVLKQWALKYTDGQLSPIVDAILDYVGENYNFAVPKKVSSRKETGLYTIHICIDVMNEDYIAMRERYGRHSMTISLSRILEYVINDEEVNPDIFNFCKYQGTPVQPKKMVDIKKFVESEQTRLMMLPQKRYETAKQLWFDNFDELWPILWYLYSTTKTNSEAVEYIAKCVDIVNNIDFKI